MKSLKRINCFACDLALSYILFYLLLFIRPVGFPIIAYYFGVLILYFTLTYRLCCASFIQKLFGIKISKYPLAYTLLKNTLVGIIPFVLFFLHYDILGILYLLAILIFTLLLLPITKKSLWQLCSCSQIESQKDIKRNKTFIIVLCFVTLLLLLFQWMRQSDRRCALPVSIPEKKYYVKNIKQYKQEPINYIMQLFDKYDIVILCERWHPECTQWDFFSNIILNDAFASKVKNVFTELGEVQNQDKLDSYMQTRFSTEEDLQRATARIVREIGGIWPIWSNKNIYDFILNLHQFNETRADINRVNYFFSDMFTDWNTIKNSSDWDSIITQSNRDSIMAYNIINRYEMLHLNKSLVIVNTRHAWNYGKNEVSYIFNKYPNKTAVVWINGFSQIMLPPMNGTLDEAALEIQDSIWAIDFTKCPLGNTHFDLMPSITPEYNELIYKNLFVGMIYCRHPYDWERECNYPFILDDYKSIFLKKSAIVGGKSLVEKENRLIKQNYYDTIDRQAKSFILILFNLFFGIIHSTVLLFLSLNLFILLFKKPKST